MDIHSILNLSSPFLCRHLSPVIHAAMTALPFPIKSGGPNFSCDNLGKAGAYCCADIPVSYSVLSDNFHSQFSERWPMYRFHMHRMFRQRKLITVRRWIPRIDQVYSSHPIQTPSQHPAYIIVEFDYTHDLMMNVNLFKYLAYDNFLKKTHHQFWWKAQLRTQAHTRKHVAYSLLLCVCVSCISWSFWAQVSACVCIRMGQWCKKL